MKKKVLVLFAMSIFTSYSGAEQTRFLTLPVETQVEFQELSGEYEGLFLRQRTTNVGQTFPADVVSEKTEEAQPVTCSHLIVRALRHRSLIQQRYKDYFNQVNALETSIEYASEAFESCFEDAIKRHGHEFPGSAHAYNDCTGQNRLLINFNDDLKDLEDKFALEHDEFILDNTDITRDVSRCRTNASRLEDQNTNSTDSSLE